MPLEEMIPKGLKLQNGNVARSKLSLLILGVMLAFLGFFILCFESWRMVTGLEGDMRWGPFRVGMGFFMLGCFLVYYLNPFQVVHKALEVIEATTPILRQRIPNGERATDPPARNEDEAALGEIVKQRRKRD